MLSGFEGRQTCLAHKGQGWRGAAAWPSGCSAPVAGTGHMAPWSQQDKAQDGLSLVAQGHYDICPDPGLKVRFTSTGTRTAAYLLGRQNSTHNIFSPGKKKSYWNFNGNYTKFISYLPPVLTEAQGMSPLFLVCGTSCFYVFILKAATWGAQMS